MIPRLAPMQAVCAAPFDSAEHLFEFQWSGLRALAACEAGRWQLWGRDRSDYTDRYPELAHLSRIPSGTMLDGVLVQSERGGRQRDARRVDEPSREETANRPDPQTEPIRYVLFDALYDRGRCLLREPLYRRRRVLRDVFERLSGRRFVFSEGIVCSGQRMLERALARGHNGVVAKHLASRYRPGQQSAAWQEIVPAQELVAVIIGFLPGPVGGVRRLLLAVPRDGTLHCLGSVPATVCGAERAALLTLLCRRVCAHPAVPCPELAVWVEPELSCQVRFREWTPDGRLRGARMERVLWSPGCPFPAAFAERRTPTRNGTVSA
jgi:bifunctional non-homologous end joining protein LigD